MVVATAVEARSRYQLLGEYGAFPLAGQLIQSTLQYFKYADGFIAFQKAGKDTIVIGDPVCHVSDRSKLIRRFLQFHPSAVFVQVHEQTAEILASQGYYLNAFGVERSLSLPYSIAGNRKGDIRHLYNAGKRNRVLVRELSKQETAQLHLYPICASGSHKKKWLALNKEFTFLSRTSSRNLPEGSRVFGGFINDTLVGYSIFDPIFSKNNLRGYAEVAPKRSRLAPKGTRVTILLEAMHQFHTEGAKKVNLGLSPLDHIKLYDESSRFPYSKITQFMLRLLFTRGNMVFNFKGLAFHKSRFRGEISPVYLASRSEIPLKSLYQIFYLTTGYKVPPLG